MYLPNSIIIRKIEHILEEDLGEGDITTSLTIPDETTVEAEFVTKENGIIAGIEEISVFLKNMGIQVESSITDGQTVKKGQRIMKIVGNARTILSVERTILNLLSRMSGIASATKIAVDKLRDAGINTIVSCTRKTAPGLA